MLTSPTLGVDTGGTFTDLVMADGDGLQVYKLASTPADPSQAILKGIAALRVGAGRPFRLVHGTTVATNTALERKGARTAFVTTFGFRDLLHIGRQTRLELYSLAPSKPEPLVAARDCYEVRERVEARGRVLTALSPEEAEAVIARIAASGAEAVAVTLLFSFANAEHEQLLGRLAEAKGLYVSLSSQVAPEHREYERASTTAINASVGPVMARYLQRLEHELAGQGCEQLRVMQSSGGILSPGAAARQPVRTLLSGPAGGVIAAAHLATLAGEPEVLTLDMGGTSTDVCLVRGEPEVVAAGEIDHLPIRVPMLPIHTIGAGGGSLARAAAGGALRVGPESAGADPGPAAYGFSDAPTVTDANLVLGRLWPAAFLGGRMPLYPELSHAALATLGERLGLSPEQAADGVVRVANVQMARALRRVSTEQGHDPRRCCLLAFGGGGPLHACELAALLGIRRVLVPPHPGLLSALGLLLSDERRDYSLNVMRATTDLDEGELERGFAALEEQARSDLGAEGVGPAEIRLLRSLEMRYHGQSYELSIPLPAQDGLAAAFHGRHAAVYGRSSPARPTEVVLARLRASIATPKPDLPFAAADPHRAPPAPIAAQQIWWGVWREAPVYSRRELQAGHQLDGPALLVQDDATTLVPPGWQVSVDGWGNLRLAQE